MNLKNKIPSFIGVQLNKVLFQFGLELVRKRRRIPKEFIKNYNKIFMSLMKNPKGFSIYKKIYYDIGIHPASYIDYECGFAAQHISRINPDKILDIGSYRHYILGLLSRSQVTTLDVRDRIPISDNETVITSNAVKLNLPDNEFDAVISLCALEHFGLGRYGDEFDLSADKKAFEEMIRVLKPNGLLIFTTTITNAKPSIVFNAHRIYSHEMLRTFCANLSCVEENFYSHKNGRFCSLKEVTTESDEWDIYCGCWKKA